MAPRWDKCCKYIPQRYVLGIMGSFAVFNGYTMRTILSMAITEMVQHKIIERDNTHVCPVPEGYELHTVQDQKKLYNWGETIQGLILSSFYWGLIVTHLPGAILAQRFGGKQVVGVGILGSSIITIITPPVVLLTGGQWGVFVGLRVLVGLFQGVAFPALNTMLAQWIAPRERATISSLTFSGGHIGIVMSLLIGGALISLTKDWTYPFYFFGGFGLLWSIVWHFICFSNPDNHPFISDQEKDYLRVHLRAQVSSVRKRVPWFQIIFSVPVWSLIICEMGHYWGWFTVAIQFPKYMKDVLRFNIKESALLSSLPFFCAWIVALASGYLCDGLINKKYLDITVARKLFTIIGALGPACFMITASYAECNKLAAVAYFVLAICLMGTYHCGSKVNALDLAPNFAGTLVAIVNSFGMFTGMVTPFIVAIITPDGSLLQWRQVFWITFFTFVFTAAVYLIFSTAEVQPWNSTTLSLKDKSSPTLQNKSALTIVEK